MARTRLDVDLHTLSVLWLLNLVQRVEVDKQWHAAAGKCAAEGRHRGYERGPLATASARGHAVLLG